MVLESCFVGLPQNMILNFLHRTLFPKDLRIFNVFIWQKLLVPWSSTRKKFHFCHCPSLSCLIPYFNGIIFITPSKHRHNKTHWAQKTRVIVFGGNGGLGFQLKSVDYHVIETECLVKDHDEIVYVVQTCVLLFDFFEKMVHLSTNEKKNGKTPLTFAAMQSNFHVAKIFVENGACIKYDK